MKGSEKVTSISSTDSRNKSGFPVWLVVGGLLFLVGIAAWIIQLRQGVGVTSLDNLNPWGNYIAGFIFFMGLSAGMLVLGALPVLFDLPNFRPYAKLAAFIALVSLVVGGLFILVDVGRPERIWRLVRFGNLGSPMVWDLLLTVVYLIVATVFLRRLMTAEADSSLKLVALVAFLAGLADGLTAFVFATQIGREFWFSAVQPMAFFTAALASACAVFVLFMVGLKASGYKVLDTDELGPLAGLTAAALALGLLLVGSEVVTLWFSRSASTLELVNAQLSSVLFWIEIALGAAAIILLVLPATRSQETWLVVGAALGLAHLAVKRIVFVEMGFAVQNLNFPGVHIAPIERSLSIVEWGVVVGLIGLFVALFSLGLSRLSLVESAEK